jgi:hypothetical protein
MTVSRLAIRRQRRSTNPGERSGASGNRAVIFIFAPFIRARNNKESLLRL